MISMQILLLASISVGGCFQAAGKPLAAAAVGGHLSKPWRIDVEPETRAQFNFKPYVLSNACFDCSRTDSNDLFACNVKFDWFDPNSVRENSVSSCSCSYTWKWDGVTSVPGPNNTFDPQAFFICYQGKSDDTLFQMRVNEFDSPRNFTLMMAHHYKDSSLFGDPDTYAETWAEPQLSLKEVARQPQSMAYFLEGPILANITGLDA